MTNGHRFPHRSPRETLVLMPWVATMPWKKQSAFFSALRGPDTAHCTNVKQLVKFLRRVSQQDADPATGYMREKDLDLRALEHELEYCSLHFVAHLVDGLAIVREFCDDAEAARKADGLLEWFADSFHLEHAG